MTFQERIHQAIAAEERVRVRVVGVCIVDGRLLYQEQSDVDGGPLGLPGGGLEPGVTFEEQLATELVEETTARLVSADYLFVVENHFSAPDGGLIHQVEHYLAMTIDTTDVRSREPHLRFGWLAMADLATADLRPHVVRDVLASGQHHTVRHLIQRASGG